MIYALSALLYFISFTDKNTEVPREYLLTQIIKPGCSIVGWALRFVLVENPFSFPSTIFKCNF